MSFPLSLCQLLRLLDKIFDNVFLHFFLKLLLFLALLFDLYMSRQLDDTLYAIYVCVSSHPIEYNWSLLLLLFKVSEDVH